MYQLISALCKPVDGNGRWVAANIASIPLNTLFIKYRRVIVTLSNPFLQLPVSLDLDLIRDKLSGRVDTFPAFLVSNGAEALPTSDVLPKINTRYAKYADAFHAGYKITPISATASPDAQLPAAEKPWLHLTRPNTDYDLLYKSCLVNVNGYFHLTDGDYSGLYVKDGMTSRTVSGQNQIGLLSFRELGTLQMIPIKADMVYKQNSRQLYKDRCYVDLKQDVSNKTVMLVLGGYLHVLDKKTFYRVGDSQFAIDFNNLPLFDRYYESRNYIDLSSLPLDQTIRNTSQISVAEFLSDENLLAYLTLSQSFFVVLDNSEIFTDKAFIHTVPLPGMHISYIKPEFPMITGVGKLANYWYTFEDGQYSLTSYDTLNANRLYNTANPARRASIADSRITVDPVRHSAAFFLQIGRDI